MTWLQLRPLQFAEERGGTPIEAFERFHKANPHVLEAVIDVAHDLRNRGFKRCSVWLIFNRLRWIYAIQTLGDEYRLNNNWTPFYARLAMAVDPSLAEFFETRQMKLDYQPDLRSLGLLLRPVAPSTPRIRKPTPIEMKSALCALRELCSEVIACGREIDPSITILGRWMAATYEHMEG